MEIARDEAREAFGRICVLVPSNDQSPVGVGKPWMQDLHSSEEAEGKSCTSGKTGDRTSGKIGALFWNRDALPTGTDRALARSQSKAPRSRQRRTNHE